MVHTGPVAGIDPRPGVVWFRRDLRLDDNPAWAAATAGHDKVIALFVLEPQLMDAAGQIRRDQLLAHLDALHLQLKDLGGGLVIRSGPAAAAIPVAITDCEASALYFNIEEPVNLRALDIALVSARHNYRDRRKQGGQFALPTMNP